MQSNPSTPAEDSYFTSWKPWVMVKESAQYHMGTSQKQAEAILADTRMTETVDGAADQDMTGVQAARKNVTTGLGEPAQAGAVQIKKAEELLKIVGDELDGARQAVRSRKASEILNRPVMKEVVADATEAEQNQVKELETAREAVKSTLPQKPGASDLVTAEKRLETVQSALNGLKAAIVQRGLQNRAKEILADKDLMEATVPGATAADKSLSEEVTKAREAARKALTANEPLTSAGVEAEKAKVQQALNNLKNAVEIRQKAAEAIRNEDSMKVVIAAVTESEKLLVTALTDARGKVLKALPEYPTVEDVAAAESLRDKEVKPKLEELTKALDARKARQEEARKLRVHGDMKRNIASNASEEEIKVLNKAREALLLKVPENSAPTPEDIKEARLLLVKVTEALNAAVEGGKDRKARQEQADAIRGNALMKQKIAEGASSDERLAVDNAREAVRNALTDAASPPSDAIQKANGLFSKVTEALSAVTEGIKLRKALLEQARKIHADGKMSNQVSKGATADEIQAVTAARESVYKVLPKEVVAPTGEAVKEAQALLLKVGDALEAATQAVVGRQQRLERATQIRSHKTITQEAAKGANTEEIKTVKDAQAAVLNALPKEGPPTPEELQEAERLLLKVQGALDAATQGVKMRQDATLHDVKQGAGREVEALLRFTEPEVLTNAIDVYGDSSVVVGLVKGCDRGRGRFAAAMEKFKDDPDRTNLKTLLTQGGFAGRPEVLGHLLDSMFTAQTEAKKDDLRKKELNQNVHITLEPKQQQAADAAALTQLAKLANAFAKDTEAPKRLQNLLDSGVFGQDPKALGDLLQNGCGGDPAKLVKLTKEFAQPTDLANLKGLMVDGGLGADPKMLATLLKDGCGGDAAKLKKLTSGYPAPDPVKVTQGDVQAVADAKHLQNLKNLVEVGGLEKHPDTLAKILKVAFDTTDNAPDLANFKNLLENGGLADQPKIAAQLLTDGCDGDPAKVAALAKQFSQPEDQANLKGLIAQGGMDHKPGVLATLLKEGCGGDPAKLKKLTSGYPAPDPQKVKQGDVKAVADQKHLQNLKKLVEGGGLGDQPGELAKVLKVAFNAPDNAPNLENFKNLIENAGLADQPKVMAHVLTVGCGSPGRVNSLTAQLSQPADQANLKGLLADGGLDHDPTILGEIVRRVDLSDPPGTMRALAAEFQGDADRKDLKGMIVDGGLGTKPTILSAMLATGCDGKPDKLKALTAAYGANQPTSVQDLQNLMGLIVDGGFADDPNAFAHLYATGCDGSPDKLKQVEQVLRPNKAKVKGLVKDGGMGGATLGDVLKTTFQGDASKLVTLHDAFAADLPGLEKIANAFSGAGAGQRFKRVLDHLKGNGSEATAIAALEGTFLQKLQGKPSLIGKAARFHINTGPINNKPNGVPPPTVAEASAASTNLGDGAEVAAQAATNAANGDVNIQQAAQETTKAATAAKNASIHALNGDYGQLRQASLDAQSAAAAVKVALENAKKDLQKAKDELSKTPQDVALIQREQALTFGVQKAQEAYDAADSAAKAAKALNKAAVLRDVSATDMDHICGRHTYWKQFTGEGLDELQSMYPQGATDAQIAAYVDEALEALIDADRSIPTAASILVAPDSTVVREVTLPKSGFQVRVVFKRNHADGKVKIRTCFPLDLETMAKADMEAIQEALGK